MNFTQGIIIKGIGGFYYVMNSEGTVFETRACGRFRKEKTVPVVGDRVRLNESCDSVTEILPRTCSFIRPPVANIEQMIVVISTVLPQVDLRLADAMLFYFETKGADSVICINKADIADAEDIERVKKIYESACYKVIVASAEENRGTDELRDVLKNKISAFSGNSGVGKSSLLSMVCGRKLETGELSRKTQRGRHTTRHVELIPLDFGGFVLDTPGFGRFDLPLMTTDNVKNYFREFKPFEGQCRFAGCMHTSEPGCAVLDALEKGIISESRMESYKSFMNELRGVKEWQLKRKGSV